LEYRKKKQGVEMNKLSHSKLMKKSGRKHSKLSLMRKKLTLRSKISPVQYPRNIGDEDQANIEQEQQANEAHEIHKEEAQAGGPSHDNDEEEQQNLVVSQVR
jgi:hypothetical protein